MAKAPKPWTASFVKGSVPVSKPPFSKIEPEFVNRQVDEGLLELLEVLVEIVVWEVVLLEVLVDETPVEVLDCDVEEVLVLVLDERPEVVDTEDAEEVEVEVVRALVVGVEEL